jgi:pimeloyl-ACP methyl ester carboxylesterase
MANFVLIHGTTQGPDGWDRLVRELAGRGHRSVAVDLASSPATSLDDLTDIVKRQVHGDFRDPIVVAHSGAGPLIPDVGHALGASRGVWLSAGVPSTDKSLREEIDLAPTEIFNPEWIGQNPTEDPVLGAYFMFHDCDLEVLQWALTTVRLFAPHFLYSGRLPLSPEFPSTYILGTRDRIIRPEWSRRVARSRLGGAPIEMDGGHCLHVSDPAGLADVLDELSRSSAQTV